MISSASGGYAAIRLIAGLLGLTLLAVAGCTSVGGALDPSPPPATETSPPPTRTRASMALSEERASELMDKLLSADPGTRSAALSAVLEAEDDRFIPVFLELLRASQIGLIRPIEAGTAAEALESLSGESFGDDWAAWVEWYGGTALEPPAGFTGWKGELLGLIDPRFAEFLQDSFHSRIRVEEIMWGGVLVDGIPALDQPAMIAAEAADYLEDGEPVFGLSINRDSRAYPLRIMDWHEMANDTVGGVPVVLSYCTLCGAAKANDGRASNGETYDFGSSGFLYRSNKLMYDRQTRTLWNQLTGEPVLGILAEGEVSLSALPVVLTTWSDWRSQHPDTLVLDLQTGFERFYSPGAAYGDYFASEETMFPVWQRSDQLEDKERIYALRVEGIPKAYPLDALVEARVVNDTLGGTDLVLVANRGRVRVDGASLRTGPVDYDSGAEVRAYVRRAGRYLPGPSLDTLLDERGRTWQIREQMLLGPEGEQAPRISGHLSYWFGWYAFFPHTLVYEPDP